MMRRLSGAVLALVAAMALPACAALPAALPSPAGLPPAPVAVAERTVVDEQAALVVVLAYEAAAKAARLAVAAGLVPAERAGELAALDRRAFAAVAAVEAAYRAGNAASYAAALTDARTAVAALFRASGA